MHDARAVAARTAALLPEATVEVVSDAGHVVGVDRPDVVNARILDFVGRHART